MTEREARSPHHPRRSAFVALLLGCVLAFAGFVVLGVWQLQRLSWKTDLIARVDQRLKAAPVAAPGPAAWPGLNTTADEYRRVELRGRFVHELETPVQASTELGAGYWILTPLVTEQGWWVLVNRGFVPPEQRARSSRIAQEPQGPQQLVGLLRFTEPGGSLLQHNDVAAGRWYSRDVQAIAAARGLGGAQHPGAVAPYFVDASAEAGAPQEAWPRPGLTVVNFRNNHLQYALTWFALAAMVAAAIGYLLISARQPGGPQETRP